MPQTPDPQPDSNRQSPASGADPSAPGGSAASRDVLVVEDDPEINQLVGAYARLAGFGYRQAGSGSDAFEEIRLNPPALIILDVMLPDLDGFEICQRIKSQPQTSGVPVVLLTALHGAEFQQRGKACGASEYLTKPFDPDRLMEAIRRHAAAAAR